MTDNYNDDLDNEQQDDEDFKNLRAKARKADTFERENMTLKRENAFIKAGIDVDDPKMGYFYKGYDGDLTSDAIKDAAISAGFMQAPPPPVDPEAQQAQQGQAGVIAASTAAQPAGGDAQGRRMEMQAAMAEGGLAGLSAVTAKYGVTFNPGQ